MFNDARKANWSLLNIYLFSECDCEFSIRRSTAKKNGIYWIKKKKGLKRASLTCFSGFKMLLLTAVVDTLVALIFMGVSVAAQAKFSISILISVSNWANELQSSTIGVPLFSFRRLGRSAFPLLAINCGDSQLLLPLQSLAITVGSITVTLLSSSTCSLSNTSEISFCKYRERMLLLAVCYVWNA